MHGRVVSSMIRRSVKLAITRALEKRGVLLVRRGPFADYVLARPGSRLLEQIFGAGPAGIYERVAEETMCPAPVITSLVEAVRYVCAERIPGAIVECGVWRGGSMMAAALALEQESERRELWLYDTFEGFTAPGEHDRWALLEEPVGQDMTGKASVTLEVVQRNMASTGYPGALVRYVKGSVSDTIPGQMPEEIALLRLDTDFYDSTAHELEHLYPRLATRGVLIIDDYGHLLGARRAVDEYLQGRLLLVPVEHSCRIAVKSAA
jgi:O-methyltransferase